MARHKVSRDIPRAQRDVAGWVQVFAQAILWSIARAQTTTPHQHAQGHPSGRMAATTRRPNPGRMAPHEAIKDR